MELDRREFLFAGAAFASSVAAAPALGSEGRDAEDHAEIDLLPQYLPGVHAYGGKYVKQGDRIEFFISSEFPYTTSVFAVDLKQPATGIDKKCDVEIKGLVSETGPNFGQPHQRLVRHGSYVQVDTSIPSTKSYDELTLECWIRMHGGSPPGAIGLMQPDRWQGIISQLGEGISGGFALQLFDNRPVLYFSNIVGGRQLGITGTDELCPGKWTHLAAVFSKGSARLYVDGKMAGEQNADDEWAVQAGASPFRIGAYGSAEGLTGHVLNGDVALPAVHSRALTVDEIQGRIFGRTTALDQPASLLAYWKFEETGELGAEVIDSSSSSRKARVVNSAVRNIDGPLEGVRAIRFAVDDLYSCGWCDPDISWRVPDVAEQGIHVLRIYYSGIDGTPQEYDVTFVVSVGAIQEKKKVLVVCSTNTWLAYNQPFMGELPPEDLANDGGKVFQPTYDEKDARNTPRTSRISLYTNHADQTPTNQVGLEMPWPFAAPYIRYGDLFGDRYAHLARADRHMHIWLRAKNISYDVITDFELHQNPNTVLDYEVVVINGHSEYWSLDSYKAIDKFQRGDAHANGRPGHLIVTSGNTMGWKVTFDREMKIMEKRNLGSVHFNDGSAGGQMRQIGSPAWTLTGLDSGVYGNDFGPFEAILDSATSGVFDTLGVRLDGAFGFAGHEGDVTLDSFPDYPERPSWYHPIVLARVGNGANKDTTFLDYDFTARSGPAGFKNSMADIIYWDRAEEGKGKVFAIGSISAGLAVRVDEKLGNFVYAVLQDFLKDPLSP